MSRVVVVNPTGARLGHLNGIMTGRHAPYTMPGYVGTLSVKYMFAGTGSWRTDEGRYQIDRRHFAVINAGERYSFHIGAGEPIETFCPFLEPGFFADVAHTLRCDDRQRLDRPGDEGRPLLFEGGLRRIDARVIPVLRTMRAAVSAGQRHDDQLDDLFRALAEALTRVGVSTRRPDAMRASTRIELSRRLRRARDYMHDQLVRPLVLDDIARAAGLSPHHFHRSFRAHFGTTPHRYLVTLRLERAGDLLTTTDWPLSEIAASVGFDSRTAFSGRFRRQHGVPPGRWRQATRCARSQE